MSGWFRQAVEQNDWEGLGLILKDGYDVDTIIHFYRTRQKAIDYSCSIGDIESVEVLLNYGADPRPADAKGPIYQAILNDKSDVLRLLLAKVKNDCEDFNVESFVKTAVDRTNNKALRLLLEKVNAGQGSFHVGSILHTAVSNGNLECLKILLEVGKADVKIKDEDGNSCLHRAVSGNQTEIVKYLLGYTNVDLEALNNEGRTAKQLFKSMEIVKLFKLLDNVLKQRKASAISNSEDSKLNAIENDVETSRNKLIKLHKEIEEIDAQTVQLNARKKKKLTVEKPAFEMELKENLARKESFLQSVEKVKQENEDDCDDSWSECPICAEVMTSPKTVYQCAEGHCFCSDCRPSLTLCPICRMDVTGLNIRSRAMEKLIENGGKM